LRTDLLKKFEKTRRLGPGSLLRRNTAVLLGISIPFAVTAATGLRPAAALIIEMLAVGLLSVTASFLTAGRAPHWVRVAINVAASAAAMLVIRGLIRAYFPDVYGSIGAYIYLMSLYGAFFLEAERARGGRAHGRSFRRLLTDMLVQAGIFAFLMLSSALVREYLGGGMLFAVPLPAPYKLPALVLPFYGFICVGFLLAGWRFVSSGLRNLWAAEYIRRADRDRARYTHIHVEGVELEEEKEDGQSR
jgi:Na+-translocating ferredoxin:NAD+ oxidoreductase RnfE subunit